MAAISLHHAALRCTLWILDQNPSLPPLDETDKENQHHKHQDEANNQETVY